MAAIPSPGSSPHGSVGEDGLVPPIQDHRRFFKINWARITPAFKITGMVSAVIVLVAGFFCFLPLPIIGAVGIITFSAPMFAIPAVGFVIMILSIFVLFRLMSKKEVGDAEVAQPVIPGSSSSSDSE